MDAAFPAVDPNKCLKTYGKMDRLTLKASVEPKPANTQLPTLPKAPERNQLTSKKAVEYLLEGNLRGKVCRFCLDVSSQLSHLDQILQVAGKGTLYKVAVKDIIASFHPFKMAEDPNFPDKICENCLDRAISSYLFTQQCDQAERALKNCFEDIYDKLCKLDPIEPKKKRGRHKLSPNYNTINVDHEKVIDYALPIINIVNTTSEVLTQQSPINDLECLKCCEILPNMESLINHATVHPKSMWYNCRLCGTSFAKRNHIKRHINSKHSAKDSTKKEAKVTYDCKKCDIAFEKCSEFLEHTEKHKFKTVMEHLTEKKMDKLCALCFNKGYKMRKLNETICLHGISPELNGDKSLYNILTATLPEIHLDSYTGTKICETCFNNALTSYIFINQSNFARNRLGTCVTAMLDKLNTITDTSKNICVEIATNAIMNINYNETDNESGEAEDNLKIDVLEDEYRLKSEDESETESVKNLKIEPKKDNEKTSKSLLNGYKYANEICGEFLTFKKRTKEKKRFICPVCQKYFVSDYFLKRHCLKHLLRKVQCIVCDLRFESKFHLYEHKKMSHVLNIGAYLSCEICGRCYTEKEKEKLLRHEKRHKNPLCQICSKKFTSQSAYMRHLHRHIKNCAIVMKKHKQFCSFCEKDCSNDNEFSLHVNKVHLQIKAYSCDMCERSFYTEYNLRCHRKVHSEFSREKCEFCNKILFSRNKMVIHVRKHIGDTPFSCQMCNESFYSKFKLNKHLSARHGGRFCCKFCTTMFLSKKEMKCHVNKVHNMF